MTEYTVEGSFGTFDNWYSNYQVDGSVKQEVASPYQGAHKSEEGVKFY